MDILEDFPTFWKVVKNINGYVTNLYGVKISKHISKSKGLCVTLVPS